MSPLVGATSIRDYSSTGAVRTAGPTAHESRPARLGEHQRVHIEHRHALLGSDAHRRGRVPPGALGGALKHARGPVSKFSPLERESCRAVHRRRREHHDVPCPLLEVLQHRPHILLVLGKRNVCYLATGRCIIGAEPDGHKQVAVALRKEGGQKVPRPPHVVASKAAIEYIRPAREIVGDRAGPAAILKAVLGDAIAKEHHSGALTEQPRGSSRRRGGGFDHGRYGGANRGCGGEPRQSGAEPPQHHLRL